MENRIRSDKGFTFIEILVILAIIAILTAILQPQLFKQIEKAKIARAEAEYNAVKAACFAYYADTKQWPNDGHEEDLIRNHESLPGWNGPYLEKPLDKNPWNDDYILNYDSRTFYIGNSTNNTQTTGNVCYLEIRGVPTESARKIDEDLDSINDNTYGVVQISGNTVYIYIGGGL